MKKITVLFALLLCSMSVQAQTKQPKTVREFFNLLPQKYFGVAIATEKYPTLFA